MLICEFWMNWVASDSISSNELADISINSILDRDLVLRVVILLSHLVAIA